MDKLCSFCQRNLGYTGKWIGVTDTTTEFPCPNVLQAYSPLIASLPAGSTAASGLTRQQLRQAVFRGTPIPTLGVATSFWHVCSNLLDTVFSGILNSPPEAAASLSKVAASPSKVAAAPEVVTPQVAPEVVTPPATPEVVTPQVAPPPADAAPPSPEAIAHKNREIRRLANAFIRFIRNPDQSTRPHAPASMQDALTTILSPASVSPNAVQLPTILRPWSDTEPLLQGNIPLPNLRRGMLVYARDKVGLWYPAVVLGVCLDWIGVHFLAWSNVHDEIIHLDKDYVRPLHGLTEFH